jgi:thioredoxin 1
MHGAAATLHNPSTYSREAPTRSEVSALEGATVLEFGTSWCGVCRAAQPVIAEAFADHPHVRHLKIEDGPRRPLGRAYRVKLWPTLVFLRDGAEVTRLVRPRDPRPIRDALARIDAQ